ncbi:MAG: tRNA-dihydrouridine synthase family protein [Stomatobaculum sp.]|nr:tRNA-dihydrouridine synthase family protein [Stomatobaculum sp.]
MESMNIYFAPMEGITGFVFRNAFHSVFGGVDKFYAPFVSPGPDIGIPKRQLRDISPENNRGIPLVPQILTARAYDFLKTAELLYSFGYREVNFNLGCPSGTVAAKGKGAGFLSDLDGLEAFFTEVFREVPGDLKISVKTRIGRYAPEEFTELLKLYNSFPVSELTVHPRILKEFYRGAVHRDVYAFAEEHAAMPLVYNGDLLDTQDIKDILRDFPATKAVMIGRGLLQDPFLAERWKAEEAGEGQADAAGQWTEAERQADAAGRQADAERRMERLASFHGALVRGYLEAYPENRNVVLARLKELWDYLGYSFPGTEKLRKKMKKSRTVEEYLAASEMLF